MATDMSGALPRCDPDLPLMSDDEIDRAIEEPSYADDDIAVPNRSSPPTPLPYEGVFKLLMQHGLDYIYSSLLGDHLSNYKANLANRTITHAYNRALRDVLKIKTHEERAARKVHAKKQEEARLQRAMEELQAQREADERAAEQAAAEAAAQAAEQAAKEDTAEEDTAEEDTAEEDALAPTSDTLEASEVVVDRPEDASEQVGGKRRKVSFDEDAIERAEAREAAREARLEHDARSARAATRKRRTTSANARYANSKTDHNYAPSDASDAQEGQDTASDAMVRLMRGSCLPMAWASDVEPSQEGACEA